MYSPYYIQRVCITTTMLAQNLETQTCIKLEEHDTDYNICGNFILVRRSFLLKSWSKDGSRIILNLSSGSKSSTMLTMMAGNTMLSVHEGVSRLARWLVLGQQLQKDWYSLQRHQQQDLLLLPQKLLQSPKQVSLANTISTNVV